ncbi:phosphate ABC transporter substrate-binding/OmpA family protein [Ectopseudomonas mendocina]|uniref:Phosphate ABC transporter substrate-binding/OmpA family protein n=1 Tax=Ectopseudomonas mendocina TaxID=300 RepID=A0ABZ2RSL6_ECTME
MSRACTLSGRENWTHTIAVLILAFVFYSLPISAFAALPPTTSDHATLRIHGSNTVGARLAPALVRGLLEEQGFQSILIKAGARDNEQLVQAQSPDGNTIIITVAAHGSGTGFAALATGEADLAASSRPIKAAELASLSALGDLSSANAEHIIALDGLAIILHPLNPLTSLTTEELAQIFAGEVSDWGELGAPPGPIHLYARDDKSGTYDTFSELVLSANAKQLAATAKRYESSEALSDAVSRDKHGIGFIGLPYIRQAKAIAIGSGDALAMSPSQTQIATEDYPLSRRLYLYSSPHSQNPWVQALVDFAQSARGQAIVQQTGFIPQTIQTVATELHEDMPANYRELAQNAQRLSVNFRFQEGSATLDNKAKRDLNRLNDFLTPHAKTQGNVVLVGFGDTRNNPQRTELLSKLRALAVRRELQRSGVRVRDFIGLGDGLPVASNQAADGRLKNRRVEVWVY